MDPRFQLITRRLLRKPVLGRQGSRFRDSQFAGLRLLVYYPARETGFEVRSRHLRSRLRQYSTWSCRVRTCVDGRGQDDEPELPDFRGEQTEGH